VRSPLIRRDADDDGEQTNAIALNALRRCLFFISAPMVFITFALPLRAEDLGATALQIGALYSLFTASIFVIRPLTGVGLDAFGRRPFS
jgi:MFS family permease